MKSVMGGVTTYYVGNTIEWTGSTSTMVKYYYAGGQRIALRTGSAAPLFLLGDHLGSTSKTYHTANGVTTEQRYTPWGETRYGSSPTSFQYTGQRKDATGLYFYNARYYDPYLNRFIQADTLVPSPGNPQSLNRYSYVLNNPLRYTDPTGHAHYNPGDPSYSTHPKVCYGYSYPQAKSQEVQKLNLTNTLSQLANVTDAFSIFESARVAAAVWEGGFKMTSTFIGGSARISFGAADIMVNGPAYVTTFQGSLRSRQLLDLGSKSLIIGPKPYMNPLVAAREALNSRATKLSLGITWAVDVYDYGWGDHANLGLRDPEFTAAMTVDTVALLTATATGAGVGSVFGPAGTIIGGGIAGGAYLWFNLSSARDTTVHWSTEHVFRHLPLPWYEK